MYCLSHFENVPKHKHNQTTVAIKGKLYLFGLDPADTIEVYVLDTISLIWTHHILRVRPFLEDEWGRFFTAIVYEDKAYIYTSRGDVYCFNPAALVDCWTKLKTEGHKPPSTFEYSACVWNHFMYIVGDADLPLKWDGFEDRPRLKELYVLDLKTMQWVQRTFEMSDQVPGRGCYFSIVVIADHMYIFGQLRPDRMAFTMPLKRRLIHMAEDNFTELWSYNFLENQWTKCEEDSVPPSRVCHAAFVYNQKMYIYGGYNEETFSYLNDFYEYNPATRRWKKVYMNGIIDGPRNRINCLSVVINNRGFFIGGIGDDRGGNPEDPTCNPLNDMYVFDCKPSLSTLCMLVIIKNKMDISKLPPPVRLQIKNMFTPYKHIIEFDRIFGTNRLVGSK